MPDTSALQGRMARCAYCRHERPSSRDLAFFEYRGPGSDDSKRRCRHCNYFDVAHTPETMARNRALKCTSFEAASEGNPHDLYYCGCRGWD